MKSKLSLIRRMLKMTLNVQRAFISSSDTAMHLDSRVLVANPMTSEAIFQLLSKLTEDLRK